MHNNTVPPNWANRKVAAIDAGARIVRRSVEEYAGSRLIDLAIERPYGRPLMLRVAEEFAPLLIAALSGHPAPHPDLGKPMPPQTPADEARERRCAAFVEGITALGEAAADYLHDTEPRAAAPVLPDTVYVVTPRRGPDPAGGVYLSEHEATAAAYVIAGEGSYIDDVVMPLRAWTRDDRLAATVRAMTLHAPHGLPVVGTDAVTAALAAACDDCGVSDPAPCGHCANCDRCHTCDRCAGRGCRCACKADVDPAGGA